MNLLGLILLFVSFPPTHVLPSSKLTFSFNFPLSLGMQSARSIRVIQPSDSRNQRVLPRYDFPVRMVNATPGVNRIMTFELQNVNSDIKIRIADDNTVVFNRPKFFVGSSGSVWASEFMELRCQESNLFICDKSITADQKLKCKILLMDKLNYYHLTTVKEDIVGNNNFLKYEKQRLASLNKAVDFASEIFPLESTQDNEINMIFSRIRGKIAELEAKHISSLKYSIWETTFLLGQLCCEAFKELRSVIPKMKTCIHEFTDAGPGVGVSNHDVKFRIAEIILLTNPDYYIRHHLANGDSSHNEVERVQSYVGDAICDGGHIEWEYKQKYEGLTDEQLGVMTIEDLEKHELERMEYNSFKVCDELTLRMDGAPAPGGFMKAYTSKRMDELFFANHQYLKDFIAAPESGKLSLPGGHYFKMLQTFADKHFEIGEKYLEYVRCSALESCMHCSETGWIGPICGRVPKPMPDYAADGYHYRGVLDTPSTLNGHTRVADDFQPRKQAKDLFEQGKLNNDEELESFCKKFIVRKETVLKYIEHMKILKINREKRAEKRKVFSDRQKNRTFQDYDWQSLFNEGLIKKLKVVELDRYLDHFQLCKNVKMKKSEKINFINAHIASRTLVYTGNLDDGSHTEYDENSESNTDEESNASMETDSDEILNDTFASSSDSDSTEDENEENDVATDMIDVESIFTRTRYGRLATNYKAKHFVSIQFLIRTF